MWRQIEYKLHVNAKKLFQSSRWAFKTNYCLSSTAVEKDDVVTHHGFVTGFVGNPYNSLTVGGKHFDQSALDGELLKSIRLLPFQNNSLALTGHKGAEQSYLVATTLLKDKENVNFTKHKIMQIIGKGVRQLQERKVSSIWVDPVDDDLVEYAAIAAHLASFSYDPLKATASQVTKPILKCFTQHSKHPDKLEESWQIGSYKAEAQNLARKLMEMPANLLTPQEFGKIAQNVLDHADNKITVHVHSKAWIEEQKMNSFLGVSQGSHQPPAFVVIEYKGGDSTFQPDVALVGKGVTFDSGGISIKPSGGMEAMRADMGGAAVVLSTLYGLSKLKVPLNVVVAIPLCENMPDGLATKPGDVVITRKGLSVQVDNTDAEGRLILADALNYVSTEYKPKLIIDVATLTGAMAVALGGACAGVFSHPLKDDQPSLITTLQADLQNVSSECLDPTWPMPLANEHVKAIKKSHLADLNNIGKSRYAGACTAAAFLSNFVDKKTDWLHVDMAGVMDAAGQHSFVREGMSGRPTRALINFLMKRAGL